MDMTTAQSHVLADLTTQMQGAVAALDAYFDAARSKADITLAPNGKPDREALKTQQHLAHGLAWLSTYVETLREVSNWAARLEENSGLGERDALLAQILFSRYLADIVGGIPMNQGETIRPHELGTLPEVDTLFHTPSVQALITKGLTPATSAAMAAMLPDTLGRATVENTGLGDTMDMVRDQFRKFSNDRVVPYAHQWHLENEYIPLDIVTEMGALGVFGLTIPKAYGGHGMGKIAMCIVSEELSRGYIGVGSLGTRSEIAAELILIGGTEAQKEKWLPAIAAADILPTAVFTEPNTGSDLGALQTLSLIHI